jgi:hypothetical protein
MINTITNVVCSVLLTVITVLRVITVQCTDIRDSDDSNNTAVVTGNCSLLWKRSKTTKQKGVQWMTDVRRFRTALWSHIQKSNVEELALQSFEMTPRSPEMSESNHPPPRRNILNYWTHWYLISFNSSPLRLHDGTGTVDPAANICSMLLTEIRV